MGDGGASGGIPPKIMCYVNSGVLNSGKFKNDLHFQLRVPPTPPRAPPGGAWGARGGIPPKIKCYVNFGVFNSGDFKNDINFHLVVYPPGPPSPPGGALGGVWGTLK